jgi:hypothetical protein
MTNMRPTHLVAAAVALAGISAAQSTAPVDTSFPMAPRGVEAAPGVAILDPDLEAIRVLTGLDEVRMLGVPAANGALLELELERVDLERLALGFQVDGSPAPGLLEGLDLSVWTGSVAGRSGSEVVLSFSNRGVRGWISDGQTLSHLLPEPGPSNDWSRSETWLVSEQGLRQLGVENSFRCAAESIQSEARPVHRPSEEPGVGYASAGVQLRECKIAIETDYQLNQVFGGDLAAETAHITSLLAAGSERYVEQISTVLTYPYVQFYTTPSDPWSTPEGGGNSIDMLNEFVNAWSGNVPGGAVLGHMLSGANLGGGVAYLDAICDTSQSFSFAVSGNLDGQTPFPITVGPLNWEFIVFTHETGHNFGSPHTHDYNPQIDNCAGGACISNGTVMSYCHLCPGGMNNMTTYFHPTVVGVMTNGANSCLPLYIGIDLVPLTLVAPDAPAPVSATIKGTAVSNVLLNWRSNPGDGFSTIAMTDQGAGSWSADLPGQPCGSSPEYFVSFDEAGFGTVNSDVVSVDVGVEAVVFADDFEANQGWTVGAPGDNATTGIWERVDPVATAAQPGDDVSVSGSLCFVTGQQPAGGSLGTNDIDGGKTTLTSPVIDLSGGDARISYWRWYSNDTGSNPSQETFEIDISNNGGSNWTSVEVVGPSGVEASGGWFFHEFQVSDFVAPSADVRMRFVASDDIGSLVEAAIDEFRVRRVECTVCQPSLGFAGPGDLSLELCGDPLSSGGTANLEVNNAAAGGTVFVVVGTVSNPLPFAGGTLVPNPQQLIVPIGADATGTASTAVAGGASAAVTVYLQALAVDLALPGAIEFSNALAADFLP